MIENTQILAAALQGRDPVLAAEAARLIGEWHLHILGSALGEYVLTSRSYSKVSAIPGLLSLQPQRAMEVLDRLFVCPNVPDDHYWYGRKGVRAAAAHGLLTLGCRTGLEYLCELASSGNPVVLRWYAPALLRVPVPAPLDVFLTVENLCQTERRNRYDPPLYSDPAMLCLLCEALGLLPDPEADGHLKFYMDFHSRFVRGQACRSYFRRHPDDAARDKICQSAALHGTDFDQLIAAEIDRDAPSLQRISSTADLAFDRASALESLASIHPGEALDAVTDGLRDRDAYVRQCAVEALGRLAPDSGEAQEKLAREETDPRVRCALAAVREGRKDTPCCV